VLPFLALLALTLLWFLLPLVPALRELVRPSDIAPLKVVDRSSGHVAYFARNFRQYLDQALPPAAGVGDYSGRMLDGTEFVRVNLRPAVLEAEEDLRTQRRLVILDTPLTLEGGETFLMELYARAALVGGPRAVYRAVYAERELTLGEASQVFRWTHAGGKLTVADRAVLRGRVSSETAVSLGSEVVFERIGAPVIAVGAEHEPPPRQPAALPLFRLPESAQRIGDHVRIEGDFEIPTGMRVSENLVVAGRLRIGLGAIVEGSVKAHRAGHRGGKDPAGTGCGGRKCGAAGYPGGHRGRARQRSHRVWPDQRDERSADPVERGATPCRTRRSGSSPTTSTSPRSRSSS
jgi:hypothetical protein